MASFGGGQEMSGDSTRLAKVLNYSPNSLPELFVKTECITSRLPLKIRFIKEKLSQSAILADVDKIVPSLSDFGNNIIEKRKFLAFLNQTTNAVKFANEIISLLNRITDKNGFIEKTNLWAFFLIQFGPYSAFTEQIIEFQAKWGGIYHGSLSVDELKNRLSLRPSYLIHDPKFAEIAETLTYDALIYRHIFTLSYSPTEHEYLSIPIYQNSNDGCLYVRDCAENGDESLVYFNKGFIQAKCKNSEQVASNFF